MKGYKAFKKGFIAYGGFTYEIGKTYRIKGKLKMCENGFHFCQNLIDVFGYYAFDEQNTVLAEVEADGAILQEGTKFCAEEIRVLKAIPWSEVSTLIKDSNYNSGYCNSGNYNSGNCNSGNYNSGFFNSDAPTMRMFNKDSGLTFEKVYALGINWSNLEKSKSIIKALPNYDAQIFFEATGIDWRDQ